jgi:hypothetical protein
MPFLRWKKSGRESLCIFQCRLKTYLDFWFKVQIYAFYLFALISCKFLTKSSQFLKNCLCWVTEISRRVCPPSCSSTSSVLDKVIFGEHLQALLSTNLHNSTKAYGTSFTIVKKIKLDNVHLKSL